jgi:hypothetical protein
MGHLHDGQPLGGADLERADAASDMVHQYLCSASGKRVEARLGEEVQDVRDRFAGQGGEVVNLGRGEAVKVDGVAFLDAAEEGGEPLKAKSRVQPPLEHDLGRSLAYSLVDAVFDIIVTEEEGLGTLFVAEEGAEPTAVDADVGVVDVAVDEKGDRTVAMERAADALSGNAKVEKVGVMVEGQRIIFREACDRGREEPCRQAPV